VNLYGLFRDPLGMPVTALGLGLYFLGCIVLARRRPVQLTALVGPLAVLYVASALGIFPFDATVKGFNKIAAGNGRVLLWLVPGLILVVTAGVTSLVGSPTRYVRRVGAAAAALLVAAPLYYDVTELPYSPHDLRPILSAMREQARPDDRLYVYYGGRQAFEWYRPRFPIADDRVVRGGCYRPAWREYLRELDALRGSGRLWVLVVHPAGINGIHEGAAIEKYLDLTAPKLGRWGAKDAFVLLYDQAGLAPRAGPPERWHPMPRGLPFDTVSLGFACTGVFPGPGGPAQARRD
jgi:hypothetical protein